jgi:carbon-monoxide dehydrogenase large subunit
LVAVMNAVTDALSEFGIRHIDMPITPARVWSAIRDAQGKAASR